jgi:hypothetical protein
MTDTGAYTDVVFGLFWLLGYPDFRTSRHFPDIRWENSLYCQRWLCGKALGEDLASFLTVRFLACCG